MIKASVLTSPHGTHTHTYHVDTLTTLQCKPYQAFILRVGISRPHLPIYQRSFSTHIFALFIYLSCFFVCAFFKLIALTHFPSFFKMFSVLFHSMYTPSVLSYY